MTSVFDRAIIAKLAGEFRDAANERDEALRKAQEANEKMREIRERAEDCGYTREQVQAEVSRQRKEEAE